MLVIDDVVGLFSYIYICIVTYFVICWGGI